MLVDKLINANRRQSSGYTALTDPGMNDGWMMLSDKYTREKEKEEKNRMVRSKILSHLSLHRDRTNDRAARNLPAITDVPEREEDG